MKKMPEKDIQIIDNIVDGVYKNLNLQWEIDEDQSKPFNLRISKDEIKEQTGRKVVRDTVIDGYKDTISSKLPKECNVTEQNGNLIVSVPSFSAVYNPMTLKDLSNNNESLERELKERLEQDD